MQKRPLGRSGLSIAPLMFGGNVFGWTADKAASFALLDAFVDAGFNAIDTAEAYSSWVPGHVGGESETIIGEWLERSGKRDQVVIATKVGWHDGSEPGLLREANIIAAAEASLKRLKTDVIDLYQSHKDDPETPFEETLGAFAKLIEQGKVRAIGASNISADRLQAALEASARTGLPRYESLQPPYNLYDRTEFEHGAQDIVERHGLGVISYYGLAAGFLTGKYRSQDDLAKSARGGSARRYLNTRGFQILGVLDEVAAELEATPAQVALAWLMAKPAVTAPIASATSVEQFEELAKAAELKLDDRLMAALDRAGA